MKSFGLNSLPRRPRGRVLSGWLSEMTDGRFGSNSTVRVDLSKRAAREAAALSGPVSQRLYARLDAKMRTAISESLTTVQRDEVESNPEFAVTLMLAYAINNRIDGVAEATGLKLAMPPESVHAMARGPLACGGDYGSADLIVEMLERSGIAAEGLASWFDFGCSSGRTARVIKAAYPEAAVAGCDPNEEAVRWASENLSEIEFAVSSTRPPSPFESDRFDIAYAISIWSHFGKEAALAWFDEMERVLKPGGLLLFTTQGLDSLAYAENMTRYGPNDYVLSYEKKQAVMNELYLDDHAFIDVFGENGDHGVVDSDWGFALLTPQWVLSQLVGKWQVLDFRPGEVQGNQDVYLLRRAS